MMTEPGFRMRKSRLNDPERCVDIGFHRPVELLRRDVENGIVSLLAARITDEDVETAEFLYGVRDKLGAERLLA